MSTRLARGDLLPNLQSGDARLSDREQSAFCAGGGKMLGYFAYANTYRDSCGY